MPLNPAIPNWRGKRVWLVGASSGIGRAVAAQLHAQGAQVIVSARQQALLDAFVQQHPGSQALVLDVTDAQAVQHAADHLQDEGQQAFLQWEFHFRMKRWRAQVPQCIHGGTLVHFDAQGRVTLHRDYWDTAEELYEKLPVLGRLMRWLRQAGSTPLPPSPSPPC